VIRDAEGATKFVKIEVCHGENRQQCEDIAYSVAHSPLVKTALFASDPNWGRLLMAIGKVNPRSDIVAAKLDVNKIDLAINGLSLLSNGEPAPDYTEKAGQAVFSQDEICICIDLGLGAADYHVWTSDLSHDYVSINADYRS
jgi:glutamate N-acetyltransferase/amino-acid N-acetyltransferase